MHLQRLYLHAASFSRRLFLLTGVGALLLVIPACATKRFKLRVEDVFYIRTVDRVIVVGHVASGSVKTGDRLTVRTGRAAVPVTVERLEHPLRVMESAGKGQQVGLVLNGIRQDQVRAGDWVQTP